MTKTLKWLGGGIAAAMLLGLAGLFSGEVAEAQPTGPPHRFAGSVSLDGEPAAAGTSVTAVVNGAECGSATVITSAAGSTYAVDVPDSCADAGDTVSFQVGGYDAAETGTWSGGGRNDLDLTASTMMPEDPMDDMGDDMGDMDECPSDDMGGDEPAEPSEDPAEPAEPGADDMSDDCPSDDMADDDPAEPAEPADDMDDMDDDMDDMDDDMDDMDDDMDDDMAPEVSDTGTGLATTSTSTSLAALLGVTALALVLGGYTVARRRR